MQKKIKSYLLRITFVYFVLTSDTHDSLTKLNLFQKEKQPGWIEESIQYCVGICFWKDVTSHWWISLHFSRQKVKAVFIVDHFFQYELVYTRYVLWYIRYVLWYTRYVLWYTLHVLLYTLYVLVCEHISLKITRGVFLSFPKSQRINLLHCFKWILFYCLWTHELFHILNDMGIFISPEKPGLHFVKE